MNTYRVKDGIDRVLPGIGRTINGMITTNATIENPLFELVVPTPAQPAPSVPVSDAVPPTPPQVAPQQPVNKEAAQ